MALFTPEELEELRRADEELDETFCQTQEEIEASRKRDRAALFDRKDPKEKKVSAQRKAYRDANREKVIAQQKAWYEANRDKVSAQQKAWYEANRDKVSAQQKAYREANREKWNAYMREYKRAKRSASAANEGEGGLA